MIENKEKNKELLLDILYKEKEQIVSFDQKASILIAVSGIIFAGMSTSFDSFKSFILDENNHKFLKFLLVFLIVVFCITFLMTVLFLIITIKPRKKRNKKDVIKSIDYYMDISNMNIDKYKEYLSIYNRNNAIPYPYE